MHFLSLKKEGQKMIGLDTGFYIEVLKGNSRAVEVWKRILDGKESACTSCLTIFELSKLSLKGVIGKMEADVTIMAIIAATKVVWIESERLLRNASKISHGLGIPAVDSLILASLLKEGADTIFSTDSHFSLYRKKGVKVITL